MSLWEYKVITSGKGGFATPALLEKFLNDLGRDEWEIVHFQTPPDNFLAFTGLVRRSTQRDWTLQDAAAAAAKAEAEKLRAEFEAKFKAAATNGPTGIEDRGPSFLEEKVAPDDGFRKPVDTSRDDEPESAEDDKDDWDKLTAAEEDELPTFFEAIKPHMRRNQRGPGMSVGVDYLAKKWEQAEEDMKGALEECGFVMPTDEDSKVEYLEYDGDLYWLNINRRGELWINTKEKPRPVFRPVKAQRVVVEEAPKSPQREQKPESGGRAADPAEASERKVESAPATEAPAAPAPAQQKQQGGPVALPEGMALLDKVRPHMRRNRRGPGGSGSTSFLARALRSSEADLKAAFLALGMTLPTSAADKPVYTEFGNELWWLNIDSRGGLWINGREKRAGETAGTASEEAPGAAATGKPAATTDGPASSEAAVAADSASGGVPADSTVAEPSPAAETASQPVADATPTSGTEAAVPTPAPASKPGDQPPVDGATRESSEVAQAATELTREVAPVAAEPAGSEDPVQIPEAVPEAVAPAGATALSGIRVFLKETRTGAAAAKIDRIATELGQSAEDVLATLVIAGLKVPEKPREKHVFVQHAGEIFWLNKNARGELWLNAKAAKLGDKEEEDTDAVEGAEVSEPAAENAEGEADKKSARRSVSRPRPKKTE